MAIIIGVTSFVFGAVIGSFLNVVVYRLPLTLLAGWRNECLQFLKEQNDTKQSLIDNSDLTTADEPLNITFNIAYPSSHCPECKAPIKAWQNIPVVSYLLLKGKCYACHTKISPRYPIIELVTGALTAFVVSQYGDSFGLNAQAGLVLLFTWSLLVLTVIDIDHQLLPDNITLPLMWLGLLANAFGLFTDLSSALFGAVFGYLSLWSVYWAFKLITKKEGMGFGDFKLLAALGAWLGWQALPLIIILSSFVGAVIGVAGILIYGRDKNIPIPFGPYLAIAGWIAFFWGEQIMQSYLHFAGAA
ncbi:MAG: leader peptidase (prepilin peptidase)/N-methyltransferase [Lentisphaeria bacterium]|jgi:leader peptidase (prepilin peptidase)/N-methyltransferase